MIRNMRGGASLLKQGSKTFRGKNETTMTSLKACSDLADIFQTSFGPNGLYKIVINHLDRVFITSDTTSIINEVEINHPAAKMVAMAAKMQEKEIGDGSSLVINFAGELCRVAMELINEGVKINQIVKGFSLAFSKVPSLLSEMKLDINIDPQNPLDLKKIITPVMATKTSNSVEDIAALLSSAIAPLLSLSPNKLDTFDVADIRVAKASGGGIKDSLAVHGLVLEGQLERGGAEISKEGVKVAVYNGSVEPQTTETKGVVLMDSAEDLLGYNAGEEKLMEAQIAKLKSLGVGLVVTGEKFADMSLHYLAKNGIAGLRVGSKFDLRRVVKLVGCKSVPLFGSDITKEDLGYCKRVSTQEIGSKQLTFLEQDAADAKIATVLIRGSTESGRLNAERAIDDGVNVVKTVSRDASILPGGGASEVELAVRIRNHFSGSKKDALFMNGIEGYTKALEMVPYLLAKSAGMDEHKTLSELTAIHSKEGENEKDAASANFGIDVNTGKICDVSETVILDLLRAKENALKLATDAVCTLLRVDSIIMAKPAGGPKFDKKADWDDD